MAHVYILKSRRSGIYYVGSTSDIDRRLREHRNGEGYTTRKFLPFSLILIHEYDTIHEARQAERRIKKMKRKDYIDKIVKDGYIKLKLRRPDPEYD